MREGAWPTLGAWEARGSRGRGRHRSLRSTLQIVVASAAVAPAVVPAAAPAAAPVAAPAAAPAAAPVVVAEKRIPAGRTGRTGYRKGRRFPAGVGRRQPVGETGVAARTPEEPAGTGTPAVGQYAKVVA